MSFNATFPVGLPVTWLNPQGVDISDGCLKDWLLDTGSLTERVQSQCTHFSLELLGQKPLAPHNNELAILAGNETSHYQVREILLCGDNQPWVFARSVIPQSFVDAELSNLGREPLGKRIFNDSRFVRSTFEICSLDAHELGFGKSATLWGRRSKFTLGQQSMIVAEIFLPNSPAYNAAYAVEKT